MKNIRAKLMVAAGVAVASILSPLSQVPAEATQIQAKSGVNIRTSNYGTATKIGYASAGKILKYLGTTSNGWYKVSYDGRTAYTSGSYWKGYTVNNTGGVNFRSGAGTSYSKLGYIYAGKEVRVLGRNGNWLYIEYNGKKGYSSKSYWNISSKLFYSLPTVGSTSSGSSTSTSTTGSKLVYQAKQLIGANYVYGGDSWSDGGFDCSGLTQYVYGKVGISIPRTATTQWNGTSNRSTYKSFRQIGDIVVLEDSSGYISHVGIYIGDNKMIHSPKPGYRVTTASLDWWYSSGRVRGYARYR